MNRGKRFTIPDGARYEDTILPPRIMDSGNSSGAGLKIMYLTLLFGMIISSPAISMLNWSASSAVCTRFASNSGFPACFGKFIDNSLPSRKEMVKNLSGSMGDPGLFAP